MASSKSLAETKEQLVGGLKVKKARETGSVALSSRYKFKSSAGSINNNNKAFTDDDESPAMN